MNTETVLLILGAQTGDFAGGKYNRGLLEAAHTHLSSRFNVLTTVIEDGYDPQEEISKWKSADSIIYQYPIYWFMMPSILKRYLDQVYAYGDFFAFNDGPYGSGGLMTGRSVMLSTTWNAPADALGGEFFEGADRDTVLLPMRKSQAYCGLDELPHFSCHDIVKNPDFERDRRLYIDHLNQVFSINPE